MAKNAAIDDTITRISRVNIRKVTAIVIEWRAEGVGQKEGEWDSEPYKDSIGEKQRYDHGMFNTSTIRRLVP